MRLPHSTTKSVLLIACLIWGGGAAFAESLSLEGTVEHSEFVQPLDGFRIGAEFDKTQLPACEEGAGSWYPVPDWLAGQWHKTGKIDVLSFTDLKTQQPVPSKKRIHVGYPTNEVLGHQKDGHGKVWTYVPVPCVVRTTQGNNTNVNVINSFDLVDQTKDTMTVRMFAVTLTVNSNNKIISICQRESLQTWTPVSEKKVSIHDSTKFFDRDGEAIYSKVVRTHSEKCGTYCPVNYIDRATQQPMQWQQSYKLPTELRNSPYVPLDLRDSFAGFLRTHNLTSLIP